MTAIAAIEVIARVLLYAWIAWIAWDYRIRQAIAARERAEAERALAEDRDRDRQIAARRASAAEVHAAAQALGASLDARPPRTPPRPAARAVGFARDYPPGRPS